MTVAEDSSNPSEQSNLLEQAMLLHKQGHISAAIPVYRQVLQSHPEHPDALLFLGLA